MVKHILELARGCLDPMNSPGMKNSDIAQLSNILENNLKKLASMLNEDGRNLLLTYSENNCEWSALNSEQAFCDGFCLGARITAEALLGAEAIKF